MLFALPLYKAYVSSGLRKTDAMWESRRNLWNYHWINPNGDPVNQAELPRSAMTSSEMPYSDTCSTR
jgi:hypothetical protein